jgi:hypothetical protein
MHKKELWVAHESAAWAEGGMGADSLVIDALKEGEWAA